jgi:hypothetical protein
MCRIMEYETNCLIYNAQLVYYKLPKSIPIQIDLINDFLGAIIYLRSVS